MGACCLLCDCRIVKTDGYGGDRLLVLPLGVCCCCPACTACCVIAGWWYATAAVAIVCLCSLGGVVLLPCMRKSAYRLSMGLFIGLAVGSLSGDALLHLIPAVSSLDSPLCVCVCVCVLSLIHI